jgi:hypothetical protein
MNKVVVAVLLTLVAVGPAYSNHSKPKPKPEPCSSYGHSCTPVKAPEPSSLALIATGLFVTGGMVLFGRKRFVNE